MGDSYVTATHPALNSVCCYTLGGKPPCQKQKKKKGLVLEIGNRAEVALWNSFTS